MGVRAIGSVFFFAALLLGGCQPEDTSHCEGLLVIDSELLRANVYGGTEKPTLVTLESKQIAAVGHLGHCTGTIIDARWALSARHCKLQPGDTFCVGDRYDDAQVCIPVRRVISHPLADLALLELADDADSYLPGLTPIPVLSEVMSCERVGELAEAAGFGTSAYADFGRRYFTAETVVGLTRDFITIHGLGRRGLCNGDSGGPLLVANAAGETRVAATLSYGEVSCRGRDEFWRVDLAYDWIQDHIAPSANSEFDRR